MSKPPETNEIKDGPRRSAMSPPDAKPFIGQLERDLFNALKAQHEAFCLMKEAAGEKIKFSLEDASKIHAADRMFYDAVVACRNARHM